MEMTWLEFDETKKSSMKLNVALHFTKYIYLTENPTSKLLSPEMIKLIKIHNITMIPKSWETLVANEISGYLVQFKKVEQNLI